MSYFVYDTRKGAVYPDRHTETMLRGVSKKGNLSQKMAEEDTTR
jgi:hypothetical protein